MSVATRIAIIGSPRAGKTTLGEQLQAALGLRLVSSDSLIELGWSKASDEVASMIEATPGIYEGVTVVRALRKLVVRHETRPVDVVFVLSHPRVDLTSGQDAMRRGCETIFTEIEADLLKRGVVVVHGLRA